MEIRTRIAPSPTGDPHVGTVYIALFNRAFAQKHNGKFILRIEDTDQSRSHPTYEKNIFDSLRWANVHWDEGPDVSGPYGPYRQSERLDIYQKHVLELLESGKAYRCFATKEELQQMREIAEKMGKTSGGYDRRYRNLSEEEIQKRLNENQPYVIRLKVPLTGECIFEDGIKGRISTPYADIDDQILLKSDGFPTYHLANVVDDHLMKITHVIRGDEWISSTPKHILLYEAFGWQKPTFMHMPLLLGKDGKKLSKRKNPTSTFYFKDSGYLPEALTNFLTLMGYSMQDGKEIYSFEDFVKNFDPTRIGISGAFFDTQKLDWINQQYIINSSEKDLLSKLKSWQLNDEFFKKLIPLCHSRMKNFSEFIELFDFLFINKLHYTEEMLCPNKMPKESSCIILTTMMLLLEKQDILRSEDIEKATHDLADIFKINHRKIVMPMLFACIMGKKFGPPFFQSCEILKKDRVRARFLKAIEFLGGLSNKKINQIKEQIETKNLSDLIKL